MRVTAGLSSMSISPDFRRSSCRRGAPDPVKLAERLLARELEGGWDIFYRAAMIYTDILGEVGLARYRELAHARWATVPELAPGEGSRERYGSRFHITQIMETLTEQSGHLNDQIAVRERDLGSPYSFLQTAELCRSHNEHDMALEWAQRGTAEFPDSPDHRLRDFLIEEYRRRGSAAEAIEHTWAAFNSRPALETYRELAIDAKALGEWDERRTAALTLLRAPLTNPDAGASRPPLRSRHDATELVLVLLWEDDPDAAWRAAIEGGCTNSLWLQLADQRRAEHPEDTLTVYRRHVEQTVAGKDKRSYAEAVRLIEQTIRPIHRVRQTGRLRRLPRRDPHQPPTQAQPDEAHGPARDTPKGTRLTRVAAAARAKASSSHLCGLIVSVHISLYNLS
jgi:hypothetical protein